MKMDVSKFKKLSSDEKQTVLRHPRGHQIVIAHNALSKDLKKQMDELPGFAEGGEVGGKEKGWLDQSLDAADSFLKDPSQWGNKINAALMGDGGTDWLAKKQEMESQRALASPVPAATLATEASALLPPAPIAMPMAQPAAPAANYAGDLRGAMNQYTQGVNDAAKAQGELGNAQAAMLDEQAQGQQAIMQSFEKNSQAAMSEISAVINDYKNQHINPNHYMENMGSGKRVATAIGLILGGMGSGLSGQENMAAKFLHQQIDRDIESQKANLGKMDNLLSHNFKQFGNMKDAVTMTAAMQNALYATKLEKAAALSKNPAAQAAAMQAAAEFKSKVIPHIQQLAQSQATQQFLKNPNASPLMKIQALPKEMRDNAMKEYAAYSTVKSQLSQVGPTMREIFKNSSLSEKISNPVQSGIRAQKAEAKLFPVIKAIVGERMTDADARTLIKPFVSGFFSNEKTLNEGIRDLEQQLLTKAQGDTPILSEFGIIPKLQGTPELKTMGGVQYQKVQGGWKRVK